MAEAVKNMLKVKALQKPAVAALVVGLLLMSDPNSALAASGGRMGGSSFSSRSSSSSSLSRSYRSSSRPSGSYSTSSYSSPSESSSWSYSTSSSPSGSYSTSSSLPVDLIVFCVALFCLCCYYYGSRGSVLKLQVGLLGSARSLQTDLNRIAENADTSTSEGLHYVLTETVLALLRHPDYWISGYSSVDVKRTMREGEILFNKLSIEERSKFDEETLVNVNNIKKQSSTIPRAGGLSNEYIAITILVAAEGEHKLPSITNSIDLKEALQKLASIPSSETKAVEVLWTPQHEDDTLSQQELLEDYPLLRPL